MAKGEIKVKRIWEDDNFLAFPDAHPVGEGHTLVIPKKHFNSLMDLNKEICETYLSTIKEVAKILMKKYKADGFNIVVNNGEVAGQGINHIHFHLLPRKPRDNVKPRF